MPGMDLHDGKPHLIDAPVTGAVTGMQDKEGLLKQCSNCTVHQLL
jgi:hypothetical protein